MVKAKTLEEEQGLAEAPDMFSGDEIQSSAAPNSNGHAAAQTAPPTTDKNYFEQYGDEVSSRNIVGTLLRFNKGEWLAGSEGVEIPEHTKMIVNMDQAMYGWIRWEEQKPVEQRMGLLVEGFRPALRHELGYGYTYGVTDPQHIDTSEWELDSVTQQPRDPWQFTHYLVMKDPRVRDELEGIYTFATSSKGGKDAVGGICKVYGKYIREEAYKNLYPVVELRKGSYTHPNKQLGKIKTPELPIVSWATKAMYGNALAIMDNPVLLALPPGEKEEHIPF